MMLAGVVWTAWIGVILFIAVVVVVVALIAGYLAQVVSTKYPPGEIRRRVNSLLQRR
jgi:TM2 domain-containing membrane protein YozV